MLAGLEACPPWILITAGFAFGAVPRRISHALSRLRLRQNQSQSEAKGSGASDGNDSS